PRRASLRVAARGGRATCRDCTPGRRGRGRTTALASSRSTLDRHAGKRSSEPRGGRSRTDRGSRRVTPVRMGRLNPDKPEGSQGGVGMQNEASTGAVYLQTNDAAKNEVVAYERSADGALTYLGAYETGGRGTGKPHLPSQSSVFLTEGGHWLLAVNPGSDEISLFAIEERGYADGPTTIPSAGQTPYGFDFTDGGALVVTEAFGGDIGKAAASSYSVAAPGTLKPVSGSVADTRSEVCWAAVTKDDRF